MITYLYQNNILIYAMVGIGVIGVLADLVCSILYQRLLKASLDIGNSNNKLLKLMRLRFETCYQIKLGVNNVDSFVDKYINRHKFCGIWLRTLEKICGKMIALCMMITIVGSFWAYYFRFGQTIFLHTLGVGIVVLTILTSTQILFDTNKKKQILCCNIKEYLENYLKAKLEHELFVQAEQVVTPSRNRTLFFEDENKARRRERFVASKKEKKKICRTKAEIEAAAEQERIIDEILKEYLA